MNLGKTISPLLDFFLPRFCPSCKRKLNLKEKVICKECRASIQVATKERIQFEYEKKFAKDGVISGFYSHFVFEKDKTLQHLVHALKYEKRFQNGIFLGEILGEVMKVRMDEWMIDYLIPVPLHSIKKAERGYNQAYYIAKGISNQTGISVNNNFMRRIKNTDSQTTMTLLERKENVGGAFSVNKRNNLSGKNFLLVDDVITTGATTSECGRVLIENNGSKVYAISVAVAD